MGRQEIFTKVFKENLFQGSESISGPGSSLGQTLNLRKQLIEVLNDINISVVVDVCGDCNWIKYIWGSLKIDKYIGIDIVEELVYKNSVQYTSDKITFKCLDIISDPLPKGDVLICRDVLCHFSYTSIFKFFENLINSDIKYVFMTTFVNAIRKNVDFPDGENWFPINLFNTPFNLNAPLILINEGCTEGNNLFKDKSLGLWGVDKLSVSPFHISK